MADLVAEELFKDWIKKQRKSLDLTQDELARQVGCSIATIRGVEQGTLRPSRQLAELIAAALEVPSGEIPAFVQWARGVLARPGAAEIPVRVATPLAYSTPVALVDGQTDHARNGAASGNAGAMRPSAVDPVNPYKGLRAFQEPDAADFFGREALTTRLLDGLSEEGDMSRFLAVVGPSGAGKSSLVRAGLIPALRRQAGPGGVQPVVVHLNPGAHPFEELEAGLLRVAVNPPPSLMEQLRADERGLARAVKRVLPDDEQSELLLVVDQFEELFTLVPEERVRADFIDSLFSAVTDPRSRLRVVVTLRADFYDRPLLYLPSTQLLSARSELVGPLSSDEMYRAIASPAQRVGLELESGLVSSIMQDIAEQPGSLPLLQYALTELYERREGHSLTLKGYRESGGVFGSLARRAEGLYMALAENEQAEARQLFLRLVTPGEGVEDTRRRVLRSELASVARDEAALERVLDLFGRYRMLTFDRDALVREPTVEVAHEALLRTWGRLREWLDESREKLLMQRRLMASAAEWRSAGSDNSFLAAGTRLAQFAGLAAEAEMGARDALALAADEQAYLARSLEEEQQQQVLEQDRQRRELSLQKRAANRLRYLVVGLAAFLLVAVALAGWALDRSQAAQAGEQVANTNLARADALRLASEATNLLLARGDTNLIGLLSLHSLRNQYTPQGDAALSGVALLGAPPRDLTGHTNSVQAAAFSPDGKYVATSSDDNTARLWEAATGKPLLVFSGHTDGVQGITFSVDGKHIFTTSRDRTAREWDVSTGRQVRLFGGHTDNATNLAVSPDGKYLVTTSDDGTARLWDLATGLTIRTFTGSNGSLSGVAISPDGKYLLAGGADNAPQMWELASGTLVRTFVGHTNYVTELAFSPDGKRMVSGSEDHSVRIWDVGTGAQLSIYSGHKDIVRDVTFSPDGKYVLSGSNDGTAQLWDATSLQILQTYRGRAGGIIGVAFSRDGASIATVGTDNVAWLWTVPQTPGEVQFTGHADAVMYASFSPDGKMVVTAGADKTARLWDAVAGKELRQFPGHTGAVNSAVFSPDGKTILTASADGTARTWDAATGEERLRFSGHRDSVGMAVFSPDGKYVVTTSHDGTARTWDAITAREIVTFTNHGARFLGKVAFSPDGRVVATSGDDKTIRIWDPMTGKEQTVLTYSDRPLGVAFSADGKYLLSGNADGIARLWDVATGKEIRRFTGHTAFVNGVAFSPDGKYALTTSNDHTARLWDVGTGAEVRRFTGHGDQVRMGTFSPDGKYIITASNDNTARLWHTDLDDTVAYVCGFLTRDLTPEERAQYGIRGQEHTCPGR
jgi:WD40 repeat protein/DNA-binding XRE family transcriptional regulator